MNAPASVIEASILVTCLSPTLLLATLAVAALLRSPPRERTVAMLTRTALVISLLAVAVALVAFFSTGATPRVVSFGTWFTFGSGAFSFDVLVDAQSLAFTTISLGICGVVGAFSFRYLHREPGFHRYFVQFAMFVLGITLVGLAGSIEVLFAGWEMIGLSSALLVAFFQERRAPVANAMRVYAVYRVSDAAMLCAAVLLHHWAGSGSLSLLFSQQAPALALDPGQALAIAILILVAVAGKSALLPFSGWLPRAMEGPTPSSAVFYGALSIHAGCFLLLRSQPLLAHSTVAQVLAVLAGATTAIYATLTARVQTDIKSALSYACLTQVGIIIVEIGLGFTTLAFIHMVGHASFRLLQFLSAPNILHDLHELENRVGGQLSGQPRGGGRYPGLEGSLYLVSLERGFVDAILNRRVVRPLLFLVTLMDKLDRLLTGSLDRNAPDSRSEAVRRR